MSVFFEVVLSILSVYSQSTYYVSSKGSDSSTCGTKNDPCAEIDQVLTNYPGSSYTVSIGAGTYFPTQITLQKDAVVIFQGIENPFITPLWRIPSFITNSATSGFEFHDVSITLSGSGDAFTTLNGTGNAVGFYNVNLTYSGYISGAFVIVAGGSLVISNMTVTDAIFSGYFINDLSNSNDNQVVITGSTFTNLTTGEHGCFLIGSANIMINSSTFTGICADSAFISFTAEDSNQFMSITNNVFSNIYSILPHIYIRNFYLSGTYIDNTTWSNSTCYFESGTLVILGSDDKGENNITLTNLKFNNCHGSYTGGILSAFISLNISNCNFSGGHGEYGNDVVHVTHYVYFTVNITNCYSTSPLPKAGILNATTYTVVDISDQFPDPSVILFKNLSKSEKNKVTRD